MNKFPESITHAYIMLTEKCPLRCKYCYIANYNNTEICKLQYVDELINKFQVKPTLVFFGGEPLLQFDLMKKIVKKYKGKCFFQVVTSGSINFIKFLKELYIPNKEDFLIQFSYDGNNSNSRIFINNKPSEVNIKQTLLEALNLGVSLETRTVISDSNVNTLFSTYIELQDLHKNFNNFYFDFNLAHQKSFDKNFFKNLNVQLISIFESIALDLNNNRDIYIPNYFLQLFYKYLSHTFTRSCDIGNYVCMRPNGDLYPCTILSQLGNNFRLGNILDQTLNFNIFEESSDISSCKKHCKLKHLCDGGCRYERIINYENWQNNICNYTCKIQLIINKCCKSFFKNLTLSAKVKLIRECKKWEQWFDVFHSDLNNARKKRGL